MSLNELHKNGIPTEIDKLKYYLETIKEDHQFIYNSILQKGEKGGLANTKSY